MLRCSRRGRHFKECVCDHPLCRDDVDAQGGVRLPADREEAELWLRKLLMPWASEAVIQKKLETRDSHRVSRRKHFYSFQHYEGKDGRVLMFPGARPKKPLLAFDPEAVRRLHPRERVRERAMQEIEAKTSAGTAGWAAQMVTRHDQMKDELREVAAERVAMRETMHEMKEDRADYMKHLHRLQTALAKARQQLKAQKKRVKELEQYTI